MRVLLVSGGGGGGGGGGIWGSMPHENIYRSYCSRFQEKKNSLFFSFPTPQSDHPNMTLVHAKLEYSVWCFWVTDHVRVFLAGIFSDNDDCEVSPMGK